MKSKEPHAPPLEAFANSLPIHLPSSDHVVCSECRACHISIKSCSLTPKPTEPVFFFDRKGSFTLAKSQPTATKLSPHNYTIFPTLLLLREVLFCSNFNSTLHRLDLIHHLNYYPNNTHHQPASLSSSKNHQTVLASRHPTWSALRAQVSPPARPSLEPSPPLVTNHLHNFECQAGVGSSRARQRTSANHQHD